MLVITLSHGNSSSFPHHEYALIFFSLNPARRSGITPLVLTDSLLYKDPATVGITESEGHLAWLVRKEEKTDANTN